MKIRPYFLRKIQVKKFKCRLLQFLFGALRVKNVLALLGALPMHKLTLVGWLFWA